MKSKLNEIFDSSMGTRRTQKGFLFNPDFRVEAARAGDWGTFIKEITDEHLENYYLKDDDREESTYEE